MKCSIVAMLGSLHGWRTRESCASLPPSTTYTF
jgi:hypothetical protein